MDNDEMRIIIVGGGVVGYSLAEHLLKEKHELSLVEWDRDLCQALSEKLDLQILVGTGSSPAILRSAGLEQADMVLAVTPNDEVNLVVCSIAAQYGVGRRIARLRNSEFAEGSKLVNLEEMGVTSVIHPEEALVDHLMQYVATPHAVESANFEQGRILMRGYRVTADMEIANKTPREIRLNIAPDVVLFVALERHGQGMIPDGDTIIEPGDIIYTLFPRESLERFLQLVGVETKSGRKIIITGDSYSALKLAERLQHTEHNVTFVDPDLEHAKRAADEFDRIDVIHGDCTQDELLRELNVSAASFFMAVSDGSDYNMLSALLAKAEGAHEIMVTTTGSRHDRLFNSIGIDHVINPRLTTAREILEIIALGGHIGAVVRLSHVDIEAVRFNVDAESSVAGMKIKKLAGKLKKGAIIGLIVREDTMLLPDGETSLEAEDHIIVVTRHKNLPAVSKLFRPRTGK